MLVISGLRRKADENYALLSSYGATSGNFLPAFRDNLSLPPSRANIRNVDNKLPLLAAEQRRRAQLSNVLYMYVLCISMS
jgi:hypothetical protein